METTGSRTGPLEESRGGGLLGRHGRWLFALLALAHLATASWMLFGSSAGDVLFELPLDDAYIHLVYADGLAHGEGFSYNPGRAAAGTSSPAWVVLLAGVRLLRVSGPALVVGAKVLGLFCAWLTSVLAALLAARAFRRPLAGWLAGLAVATDPGFTMTAISGMEVALTAAALMGALAAMAYRRPVLCGLALALAVLSRHESMLLVPLLAGLATVSAREGGTRPAEAALRVFAPPVAAFSLWCARNLGVSGRPFPNPFYVKHVDASVLAHLADAPLVFGSTLLDVPALAFGAALLPLAVAVFVLARRGERALAAAWIAVPLVYLAGVVWAHSISEWLPLYWRRYSLVATPPLLALFGAGMAVAFAEVRRLLVRPWPRRAAMGLVLAIGAVALVLLPLRVSRDAEHYARSGLNIRDMHGRVAAWLTEHAEPDEWIASNDAGAIRLLTERPVLDLGGLNDHRVPARLEEALAEAEPRYWVVFETWFALSRNPRFTAVYRARADDFVICERCDQSELVVYERR